MLLIDDEAGDGRLASVEIDFVCAGAFSLSLLVAASVPTFERSLPTDTKLLRLADEELRSLS